MSKKNWIKIIIGIGIVLRLIPYFFNRSLWYDEAMLVNNIVQLSFRELTGALQFGQIAPIGFLWLEKLSLLFGGNNELALRFFPLLASIGSLFLFYKILTHFFDETFSLWAMAFFVLSTALIYYGTEVKQYSFDVFTTLLLTLFSINVLKNQSPKNAILKWGTVSIIAVWFSQPIVFVLAASSSIIFYHLIKNHKKSIPSFIVCCLFWMGSFAFYYFNFLASRIDGTSLQSFHQAYFMPLNFWKWESLKWYWETYFGLFRNPGSILFKYLAGVVAMIGLVMGFKNHKKILLLLLFPVLLAIGASAFGRYSTIPRVMLFASPFLFIILTKGIEVSFQFLRGQKNGEQLKYFALIIGGLILLQPVLNNIQNIVQPKKIEEIKTPLSFIEENKKNGDILYIYHYAIPQFDYYKSKFSLDQMKIINGISPYEKWQEQLDNLPKQSRVWLILSHYNRQGTIDAEVFPSYMNKLGTLLDKKEDVGSACYLYKLR